MKEWPKECIKSREKLLGVDSTGADRLNDVYNKLGAAEAQ